MATQMIDTLACALVLVLANAAAQDPTGDPAPVATAPDPKLAWPRDTQRVVCTVAGTDYTLKDLLAHVAERHYPPIQKLMESPGGAGFLQSPRMAEWVRAFADVKTLELEATDRKLAFDDARSALGDALKRDFETWMTAYRARREREGAPLELTQDRINLLLSEYQRDEGLRSEAKGWLDALVPAVPIEATGKLRDFYEARPQFFGGAVDIAQILIEHRDPRTLELKTGEAHANAWKKVADVRSRLLADGSNFEDVARLLSDDRRTARHGGRLDGLRRFDPRLPAALCRTAWNLKDGEISEPFESPYGIHIVKRIGYEHLYYVVFTDQIKADIASTMRKLEQEDLLFAARERRGVTLRY